MIGVSVTATLGGPGDSRDTINLEEPPQDDE